MYLPRLNQQPGMELTVKYMDVQKDIKLLVPKLHKQLLKQNKIKTVPTRKGKWKYIELIRHKDEEKLLNNKVVLTIGIHEDYPFDVSFPLHCLSLLGLKYDYSVSFENCDVYTAYRDGEMIAFALDEGSWLSPVPDILLTDNLEKSEELVPDIRYLKDKVEVTVLGKTYTYTYRQFDNSYCMKDEIYNWYLDTNPTETLDFETYIETMEKIQGPANFTNYYVKNQIEQALSQIKDTDIIDFLESLEGKTEEERQAIIEAFNEKTGLEIERVEKIDNDEEDDDD